MVFLFIPFLQLHPAASNEVRDPASWCAHCVENRKGGRPLKYFCCTGSPPLGGKYLLLLTIAITTTNSTAATTTTPTTSTAAAAAATATATATAAAIATSSTLLYFYGRVVFRNHVLVVCVTDCSFVFQKLTLLHCLITASSNVCKIIAFSGIIAGGIFSASEPILHFSHVAYVCRFWDGDKPQRNGEKIRRNGEKNQEPKIWKLKPRKELETTKI